jgi:multiple sugar transport system permease protein
MSNIETSRRRMSLYRRPYFPFLLIAPAVVTLLAIGFYPLIYALNLSVSNVVLNRPWIPSEFIGPANFASVLTDGHVRHSFRVTLIFTVSAVTLELLLGLGLALLMRRPRFGSGFFRTAFIVPMVTTPVIVGLMWRFMLQPSVGVLDYYGRQLSLVAGVEIPLWLSDAAWTLPAVIFVDVWHWTPFMFLILSAGLSAIPRAPIDAALVDGASRFYVFRTVTLPMLKPALLIALLFRTIDAIITFDEVFVLTSGGPGNATDVLSMFLYRMSFVYFHTSRGAALALLMVFALLMIANLYIRSMRREVDSA